MLKYIRDASSDNYHIVLLGDFNADLDNPRLSKADKRFFTHLNNLNLFDAFSVKFDRHRIDYTTHRSYNSSSRIDFIFSSVEIISNLIQCHTVDTPVFSDHMIVILKFANFLNSKNVKRNIPLKKVFDYDKMDDDKWKAFSEKTDALAKGCSLRLLDNKVIFTQSKLNRF